MHHSPTRHSFRSPVRLALASIGAAALLAGCSTAPDAADEAAAAGTKAAVDGGGVVDAFRSAVDEEAVKAMAEGAAKQAIRDAIPVEQLGVVGAVVDEQALMEGLDKAVDGSAIGASVDNITARAAAAAKAAAADPAKTPAE